MRILTVHADYIEVEPKKKALQDAEELKEEKQREEEVLVVFTSVEKGDEDVARAAEQLAQESIAVADQVKTKNILLYPLVHLTSKPAAPRVALKVLQTAEKAIQKKGYRCTHSPFGWYKAYTLRCKGHPLSELSRELKAEGDKGKIKEEGEAVSESLRSEAQLKSKFYILDESGKLHEIDKFNFKGHENLKKFAEYEMKKQRTYDKEPPHIQLMKDHALVRYEPASDAGNFRWLPKGELIKGLLERYITQLSVAYGAMQVETPIMYDFEHPALKSYLNRFPARQYTLHSDERKFFLKFSACFGQFLAAKDMVITYRNLPFKIYELTHYSFRREQSGELTGLKRLRAFSMPDMHTLCKDTEQAKAEFEKQYDLCRNWNQDLAIDYEVAFRAQTDFFKENKQWYEQMLKKRGRPMLLELYDERYAYFITKFEMNFIDAADKATALSTVQIDVENSERFGLQYVDEKGQKQHGPILHTSVPGAIERVLYALLEREAMRMQKGEKAMMPVWLSPTQLRLIPVSQEQKEHCEKLLQQLHPHSIRVDLDDRDETLGKKIREAEKEWIPFIAVVGEKEIQSGRLAVTIRAKGEKKEMKPDELTALIEKENSGKPFEQLSLLPLLSRRPVI